VGNTSTWPLLPVVKEARGEYMCEVVDKLKNYKVVAKDSLTVYCKFVSSIKQAAHSPPTHAASSGF
jgi:hypothetical protein